MGINGHTQTDCQNRSYDNRYNGVCIKGGTSTVSATQSEAQTDTEISIMGIKGHRQTDTEISIYGHKMDADRQIQISPYMSINGHRQTDGQYRSYRDLHIWT